MAEDQKLQLQRPQDFFPKEEEQEGQNPRRLYTGLFLSCLFFHPTLNNFAICHVLTYGNTKCINFPVNFLLINELLFKNRLVLDFSLMTRAEIKQCENFPVYITLQCFKNAKATACTEIV